MKSILTKSEKNFASSLGTYNNIIFFEAGVRFLPTS